MRSTLSYLSVSEIENNMEILIESSTRNEVEHEKKFSISIQSTTHNDVLTLLISDDFQTFSEISEDSQDPEVSEGQVNISEHVPEILPANFRTLPNVAERGSEMFRLFSKLKILKEEHRS